ncbi:hypothetical protein Acsp02_21240 [Actinoplanes sp. NBRC 103695]|nr:hypothetical protein Acsp02_21240 [Actinoplanes sp. NBRC 103695]
MSGRRGAWHTRMGPPPRDGGGSNRERAPGPHGKWLIRGPAERARGSVCANTYYQTTFS